MSQHGSSFTFHQWIFPFSQLLRPCARRAEGERALGPAPMERSWAVESLDSLWFFSNVLSRARPSFSAAEAEETEEEEEPVKNQAKEPEDEAGRAQPVDQTCEDSLPQCPRCGNLDAEVAELVVMKPSTEEAVGTPESAEEESTLNVRIRRSKSRQRSKGMFYERRRRRRRVLGELDLARDGKGFSGSEGTRFLGTHGQGFGAGSEVQAMKKMLPPLNDGIAMREHLRSWAIAVACVVK